MRVLCVVPSYWPAVQFGGPIFSVHNLNKALVKKSIDVTVYTTNVGLEGKVPTNQVVDIDGVKVNYFTFTKFFEFLGVTGWQLSFTLTNALKKNLKSFDLVHIVGAWNYPIAATAHYCRKYKKPYLITAVGHLYPYSLRRKFWKKWFYYHFVTKRDLQGASIIHYTTEDELKKCHSFLNLQNRTIVIPNAIDAAEFINLPEKGKLKEQYPALKGKKVILFLGRINWKKGLDLLIRAYSVLLGYRNDIHLLIVGNDEGGYIKKVKKWIKKFGIEDKVTFTGVLIGKEKIAAYVGSDVFVLPSYSENFGMAVVEAMACGVPLIISNQVGIQKDIIEAKAGEVIEAKTEHLVSAIIKLLDNPNISHEMAENAKKLVREKFEIEKVSDEMIDLFREIIYKVN